RRRNRQCCRSSRGRTRSRSRTSRRVSRSRSTAASVPTCSSARMARAEAGCTRTRDAADAAIRRTTGRRTGTHKFPATGKFVRSKGMKGGPRERDRLLRTGARVISQRCSLTHSTRGWTMRGRILITALFLAAVPAAASAQIGVSAGAGVAIPTGDFGDFVDTGLHLQGSLNIGLPLLPDVRIDGMYETYDGDADVSSDIIGGSVNLLLDMPLVVIK